MGGVREGGIVDYTPRQALSIKTKWGRGGLMSTLELKFRCVSFY